MEDINVLLSSKYDEFARKILALQSLKLIIEEFLITNREEYNDSLIELQRINQRAKEAQEEFEGWKKEYFSNCGDG